MIKNPFSDYILFIKQKHGEETWVTVYQNTINIDDDQENKMYCALVTQEEAKKALSNTGWDIMEGDERPGFMVVHDNGVKSTSYYTSENEQYLRLVLKRHFYGKKEEYTEILEEFRLYHNIYFDQTSSKYLVFDDEGNEIEVIKITDKKVEIKIEYLQQFMAARQMHLLLYFVSTRFFKEKIKFSTKEISEDLSYVIKSSNSYSSGYQSLCTIVGKKIIRCGPVENCGMWPFADTFKFMDFVTGEYIK